MPIERSRNPAVGGSSSRRRRGAVASLARCAMLRDVAVDPKVIWHEYLQSARDVMLWKLEGLTEYDIRRPLVSTSTNLLGLVRHVTCTEIGYFGVVFGRPFEEPLTWRSDREVNGDMWVRSHETTQNVVSMYRRVWAHSDETISALPLDAVGEVPWWPEGDRELSLAQAMVHVISDVY
ncbi:MAG: DinB family protein, partial [Ilumatobacteraceae bacterium]